MAETEQPPGDGIPEFVQKLAENPNDVKNVYCLTGFLGKSDIPNYRRLYLNHHLTVHVDIPERNCPGCIRSSTRSKRVDHFLRVSREGLKDVPLLLFGG
jgi:hypothetical protein